jgi:hypothetical protein
VAVSVGGGLDAHALHTADVAADVAFVWLLHQLHMGPSEGEHLVLADVVTVKSVLEIRSHWISTYEYIEHIISCVDSDGHGT